MSGQRDDPAWHVARRRGIGGSDAAAVLGISPWRTRYDVWADKTGAGEPVPETEPMRWGTLMEPLVRAEYERITGHAVQIVPDIQRHPKHLWMIGSLDGRVDDGRVLEIKTARTARGWGEPGTDEIPQHYLPQVHHYLTVVGAPLADVVVLIGGSELRIYHVEADRELSESLIDAEAEFWSFVERREPPDVVTVGDAMRRWGRLDAPGSVIADRALVDAVERLRDIKRRADALAVDEEIEKAKIMRTLGEIGDTLLDDAGHILATWKRGKAASRVDVKALTAAHPELAAEFITQSAPMRRFLLK